MDGSRRRRRLGARRGGDDVAASGAGSAVGERERVAAFWQAQRAAMKAFKSEGDPARAAELFREALALDPSHGDARYYLSLSLAELGETRGPPWPSSRRSGGRIPRAYGRTDSGEPFAPSTPADLKISRRPGAALERAVEINPEETGLSWYWGSWRCSRATRRSPEQRFEWACRTNPRAVGGFFLRAYLAWKRGDAAASRRLLDEAQAARGEDWKPRAPPPRGDVARRMHREETPSLAVLEGLERRERRRRGFRGAGAAVGSRFLTCRRDRGMWFHGCPLTTVTDSPAWHESPVSMAASAGGSA